MKRRISCIVCSLIFFALIDQVGFCQETLQAKRDSLHAQFVRDSARIYKPKKFSFIISSDKRNSFIHESSKIPVSVNGFQIGVELFQKHSFGFGGYTVLHTSQSHSAVDEKQGTITLNLKMSYSTIFYEYLFIDTKRWEIGADFEIGGGNYQTTATDSAGKKVKTFADTLQRGILVLGTGINVDFKIFRWLGINGMCGYRVVGGNEPNKVNFNGAFYSLGIQIYFGELLRMARVGIKRVHYWHEDDRLVESQFKTQ